jgi:alpha-tubulin suppressor-like RCC1 family protein
VSYDYDWHKVATGLETVCGIRDNGKIYCWGKNDYGQLGIGLNPNVNVPTEVTKDGISDWVDISASAMAFCAVRSTGQLYCWGRHEVGGTRRFGVADVTIEPTLINVHNDWAQVSISGTQICALRTNGRAYCWGENMRGELGNNTGTTSESAPKEIFGNHSDWTSIKAANNISCGIRNGGRLYCWGGNDFGQLGDGTTIQRNSPVPVFGVVNDWVDYTLFSLGGCGIRSDNKTYCWGRNVNGQLGDGTTINRSSPVEVIMPTP